MKRLTFLILTLLTQSSWAVTTTFFYIDPAWHGTTNGAAATPWNNLNSPATTQWTAIRAALATGNVTVYFNALLTDGATKVTATNNFIQAFRNDGSNALYGLTFDGGSFYNTSEVTPNWVANPFDPHLGYTNGHVYCLLEISNITGIVPTPPSWQAQAMGWSRTATYPKQSKVTNMFFELTGDGACAAAEGDTNDWEYLFIHDVTLKQPGFTLLYTIADNATLASSQIMAQCTNFLVRYLRISNTFGENLYLGSVDPNIPTNVQVQMGNQHYFVEVASNFLAAGGDGAGGSSINTKNGIINLWVHDNVILGCVTNQQWGIAIPQTVDGTYENCVIERNFITGSHTGSSTPANGIYAITDSNLFGFNGVIVRNNIVISNGDGIKIQGSGPATITGHWGLVTNFFVYNNDFLDNDGAGITCLNASLAAFTNNVVISNSVKSSFSPNVTMSILSGGAINSDYNAFEPATSWGSEGAHSITLANVNEFVNVNAMNFNLYAGVACIGAGFNCYGATAGGTNDLAWHYLPANGSWDIGALRGGLFIVGQ